jgi:SPX domain protein involved in polyphosphate accumulation
MFELLEVKKWRYERKFVVPGIDKYEIETHLKMHPAMFSEIFTERSINNIYLDWPGLSSFWENIIGQSQRLKVRIRWYGNLVGFIEKPVLELKVKNGYLGGKLSFPLASFSLDSKLRLEDIISIIENSAIPNLIKPDMSNLRLSLLNSYKRKYFLSSDKKFRVTIDSNLNYYSIKNRENEFKSRPFSNESLIVEMKYEQGSDNEAHLISERFVFRNTKSSKYVEGIKCVG